MFIWNGPKNWKLHEGSILGFVLPPPIIIEMFKALYNSNVILTLLLVEINAKTKDFQLLHVALAFNKSQNFSFSKMIVKISGGKIVLMQAILEWNCLSMFTRNWVKRIQLAAYFISL